MNRRREVWINRLKSMSCHEKYYKTLRKVLAYVITCPANVEALTHFSWSTVSHFSAGRLQIFLKKTPLMFVISLS